MAQTIFRIISIWIGKKSNTFLILNAVFVDKIKPFMKKKSYGPFLFFFYNVRNAFIFIDYD